MNWAKGLTAVKDGLAVDEEKEKSDDRVILLLLAALRYNINKSSGIVLFLLEHGNHSYRGLAICQ